MRNGDSKSSETLNLVSRKTSKLTNYGVPSGKFTRFEFNGEGIDMKRTLNTAA